MSAPRGVSFHVPVKPVSVNRRYVGRTFRLSPEYRAFTEAVQLCASRAMSRLSPLEGPLSVDLTLTLPNPAQDIDGPAKPILDALEHAGVFENDRQVVELRITKAHSPNKADAGVTVSVREAA